MRFGEAAGAAQSFLVALQWRDNLGNLAMWGSCPRGHIRRGRWREDAFGEPIPDPYCPACERAAERRAAEEADRAAWEASVKAKLIEAGFHIASGRAVRWADLPCASYPRCCGIDWPELPSHYHVIGTSDAWELHRNPDGTVTEVIAGRVAQPYDGLIATLGEGYTDARS